MTTAFRGSGIEYFARKAEGYGEVILFLDGKSEGRIALGLKNFPALSEVSVFRKLALTGNPHTLKIVNAGDQPVTAQYLKVYR